MLASFFKLCVGSTPLRSLYVQANTSLYSFRVLIKSSSSSWLRSEAIQAGLVSSPGSAKSIFFDPYGPSYDSPGACWVRIGC